ncbi:hypothetical protein IJ556_04730 [bacterium]|nr:hypothetical protein [bacterium]
MGTAQTRANNKYIAKAYDRVNLLLKKGEKEQVNSHAEKQGESLNGFINRAIKETIERDNQTKSTQPTETSGLHHTAWEQEPYQMPWESDEEFKARITTPTEEPADAGLNNNF